MAEINTGDPALTPFSGPYTPQKAAELKAYTFDRAALGQRNLGYERLDQLTIDLLLDMFS